MRFYLIAFILNLATHTTLAELPAEGERVEIRRHHIIERVTITPGIGAVGAPGAASDPAAALRQEGATGLGAGRETAVPTPESRGAESGAWRQMGSKDSYPFGQYDSNSEDWRTGGNVVDLPTEVRDRLELSVWQMKDGQWVREALQFPVSGNSQVWGFDPTGRVWYQLTDAGDFSAAKPSPNVEYVRRRMEKLSSR
jgi:hypothetical protein